MKWAGIGFLLLGACVVVFLARSPREPADGEVPRPTPAPIALLPDRGPHALRGRVLRPDGSPFSGPVVVTEREPSRRFPQPSVPALHVAPAEAPDPWSRRARADEEGRFAVTGLRPGTVSLACEVDGKRRALASRLPVPYRGDLTLVVPDAGPPETPEPGRVSGRVSDANGSPAPGVVVSVAGRRATTDPHGRFALPNVPPGRHRVDARGSGRVLASPRSVAVAPGGEGRLDLRVGPSTVLRGRVTGAEGEPVAGARVLAGELGEKHPGEPVRVRADQGGRFVFPDLVPGRLYWLEARAPGRAIVTTGPYRGASGETVEVEVTLPAAAPVEVRVVTAGTGEPVFGAEVVLVETEGRTHRERSWLTDRDGIARLDELPPGRLDVDARHPGYLPLTRHVRLPGVPRPSPVVIELEPGAALEGRVVVPGETGPISGVVWTVYSSLDLPFPVEREAAVEQDGRFRLIGLLPGPGAYDLRAEVEVGGVRYEGKAYAEPGGSPAEIRVESAGGREDVVVRVTDSDGSPVPRAWLHLENGSDFRWHEVEDGAAVLGRLGRSFVLTASDARDRYGEPLPLAPVRCGPFDVDETEIEIVLPPARTVSGVVRGPDGEPLADVRVWAEPVGTAARVVAPDTRTDGKGRFVLTGLGRGSYRIRASAPEGLRCEPVEAPFGVEDHVIAMRAERPVRIRVTDPAGEGVPGVRVRARWWWAINHSSVHADEFTGPDGSARLFGLDPEKGYVLELDPPFARRELIPGRRCDFVPEDATFRLEAGRFVRGRIEAPAGAPVTAPEVVAEWAGGVRRSFAAFDGSFELGPLPEGPVTLMALPPGISRDEFLGPRLEVRPGDGEVRLPYEPGLPLTIRIGSDETLRRGGQAWLVSETTGRAAEALVSKDGTAVFEALPPRDRFTLLVRQWGTPRCAFAAGLRPGTGELAIPLVPGGRITGALLLPEGARDPRVSAHRGEVVFEGRSGPDGFEIEGLPPGEWEVRAVADTEGGEVTGSVRATTGERVEIPLD